MTRTSTRWWLFLSGLSLFGALYGCARSADDRATIQIQLPGKAPANPLLRPFSFVNPVISSGPNFGLPDPATVADIDCYGIMVRYPELSAINTCNDDAGVYLFSPDEMHGLFPASNNLSAQIRIGPQRTFYLLALSENLGYCPALNSDLDDVEADLSHPIYVGSATSDIVDGNNLVTISGSLGSGDRVGDCTGPLFNQYDSSNFKPTDLSGLVAWYDPADNATVFSNAACTTPAVAGTDSVGCIKDKSGNSNNATQATVANQPFYSALAINTRPAMTFDGSTDYLDLGASVQTSADGTYIVVYNTADATAAKRVLIGSSPAGEESSLYLDATHHLAGSADASATTGATAGVNSGSAELAMYSWESSGGTRQVYLNDPNTPDGSSTASIILVGNSNDYLGALNSGTASAFYPGKIAEVMVFNRQLSSTELGQIKNYIHIRWGTP